MPEEVVVAGGVRLVEQPAGHLERHGMERQQGVHRFRHGGGIATAYLHMSKIGEGMRNGTRVKQGDIIGYVGSTGLATGPHVCFRFWKNGQQIDHRNEKFQSSEPIKEENREAYMKVMNGYKKMLDSLDFTLPVAKPLKAKKAKSLTTEGRKSK